MTVPFISLAIKRVNHWTPSLRSFRFDIPTGNYYLLSLPLNLFLFPLLRAFRKKRGVEENGKRGRKEGWEGGGYGGWATQRYHSVLIPPLLSLVSLLLDSEEKRFVHWSSKTRKNKEISMCENKGYKRTSCNRWYCSCSVEFSVGLLERTPCKVHHSPQGTSAAAIRPVPSYTVPSVGLSDPKTIIVDVASYKNI